MSDFTPNAFPAKISSQCGHYDHHHEELLLEALQQIEQIQVHSSFVSLSTMQARQLSQATIRSRLLIAH